MSRKRRWRRRTPICRCPAYPFPHRWGGGVCDGCEQCNGPVPCKWDDYAMHDAEGPILAPHAHVHTAFCGCLDPDERRPYRPWEERP